MSIIRLWPVLICLLAAAPPSPLVAAPASDCAAIEDGDERLACYDRLHEPRPDAGAGEAPGVVPSPPRQEEPRASAEATAEVVASGQGLTGRRWYRLDNGETWEQVTAGRTGIAVGDAVRISEGAIGTYHLRRADGGSRSTRVRRAE